MCSIPGDIGLITLYSIYAQHKKHPKIIEISYGRYSLKIDFQQYLWSTVAWFSSKIMVVLHFEIQIPLKVIYKDR